VGHAVRVPVLAGHVVRVLVVSQEQEPVVSQAVFLVLEGPEVRLVLGLENPERAEYPELVEAAHEPRREVAAYQTEPCFAAS
jgi:aspartate-semialdehyde dehydrogenase